MKKKLYLLCFKGMFQVQNKLTFISSIWEKFFFLNLSWLQKCTQAGNERGHALQGFKCRKKLAFIFVKSLAWIQFFFIILNFVHFASFYDTTFLGTWFSSLLIASFGSDLYLLYMVRKQVWNKMYLCTFKISKHVMFKLCRNSFEYCRTCCAALFTFIVSAF